MSALQRFTHFPELPEELRRIIWELSFLPRLIPLECDVELVDENYPPPAIQQVEQRYNLTTFIPFVNLSFYDPRDALSKSVSDLNFDSHSAYLTVEKKYTTPPALKVNRESREWAILGGYTAWRMRRSMKFRNIMWNPKIDIVDFSQCYQEALLACGDVMNPLPHLSMLVKQFPVEATEIRYLSLSSKYWIANKHLHITTIWPLIDYLSLRELVVVVDKKWERNLVLDMLYDTPSNHAAPNGWIPLHWDTWAVPYDLIVQVLDLRDHYDQWWPERRPHFQVPSVRVVMDADGIFNGEERYMHLRCEPCPDLDDP